MFDFFKKFSRPKTTPTFRDSFFGPLARNSDGVWSGEMPFRNYHVKVLLSGSEFQPSSKRLALARTLAPDMQAKVDSALNYAAEVDPKLWRGKLSFSALNLLYDADGDGFALDFVALGDLSGKGWQVRFEQGKPVQIEYAQRAG